LSILPDNFLEEDIFFATKNKKIPSGAKETASLLFHCWEDFLKKIRHKKIYLGHFKNVVELHDWTRANQLYAACP
jgi:hypothetical protein